MLRSNQISCVDNATFTGLSSVRLLSLYDNRISTIAPGAFNTLHSLSTMWVLHPTHTHTHITLCVMGSHDQLCLHNQLEFFSAKKIIERIKVQLSLLPYKSICWSSCIRTKPTNELVEKFTKTQEVKHSLSGHAPPPIKRLLYLHMQSGWGCGSSKEFLLFADVFQNYEVMFMRLCLLFLNLRWENVGLPRGAGWIIQKWLKGKIALLSKNGLKILCDDDVHTKANVVNSFFCHFVFAFDCML